MTNTPIPRWRKELINSIRTFEDLKKYVTLTTKEQQTLPGIIKKFQMGITPYYASLIHKDNPTDPIRRIVVPAAQELHAEGFYDTSGEDENTKVRGLQHKYENTALILSTPACTSYCRYCFRKRFTLGQESKFETAVDWDGASKYLKAHKEIDNVLISGGDPFVLPNTRIKFMLDKLKEIPNIQAVRFGTKFPAFNPFRFSQDKELMDLLRDYNKNHKKIYIVSHFDHPRELTGEAIKALKTMLANGLNIVNQAVLLKGINDNADTIAELCNELYSAGVAPYYIFQQRPVLGSNHTRVSISRGLEIIEQAKKKMSGLAKRARYIMSHYTGKVEIFAKTIINGEPNVILKYHNARDNDEIGKVIIAPLSKDDYWLNDIHEDVKEICTDDKFQKVDITKSREEGLVEEE